MHPPPANRRRRHADETHREILTAARRRFAQKGYRATTVRDVADEAGVSVQTVYDSVGSKRALVLELNNQIDVEAGIPLLAMAAATETDPIAVLAVPARIACALVEHCGDVIRASYAGAIEEPELAAVVTEGHRRHVQGAGMVTARLAALGAVAADADLAELTATVAAVTDVEVALMLVDRYDWSTARLEQWMVGTLRRLVLD